MQFSNPLPILMGSRVQSFLSTSGGGSIVNIGSVADITGNFSTAYSSSKWAVEELSRSAAYVYADWGLRGNVLQPGFIETHLTAPMTSNPLMKKMQSNAMNNTALFLASEKSSYITGTDIVVDGGWFSSTPYLANERSHQKLSFWMSRTRQKI